MSARSPSPTEEEDNHCTGRDPHVSDHDKRLSRLTEAVNDMAARQFGTDRAVLEILRKLDSLSKPGQGHKEYDSPPPPALTEESRRLQ